MKYSQLFRACIDSGNQALFLLRQVKPGSQYDTGAMSVVSVMEKSFFHQSNCIPDVKFFDNLIGWTLANARDATLE